MHACNVGKDAENLFAKNTSVNKRYLEKTYYFLGKAHRMRELYNTAESYYKKVLEVNPRNQEVHEERKLLRHDRKECNKEFGKVASKMFTGRGYRDLSDCDSDTETVVPNDQ